ncbi:MAG: DUF362 domain-containing protein [Candidatus Omnitrophota bacterium]
MNPIVAIERCDSYRLSAVRGAVENALAPLGGMPAFVKRGDRVLLKPNLLFAKPAEMAVTTHPALVEAVALMVLDCGGIPVIGDSPPMTSALRAARACGVAAAAQRCGVEIVEFRHPASVFRRQPILTAGVAVPQMEKSLLEMDVIINLPKFKSHQQMLLTCAVKNLYGCVVARRKAFWHFRLRRNPLLFAEMLLALLERISPELTIVDAVVGMEGNGPGHGQPKPIGLILAGRNAIAIDRVAAEIVNIPWKEHFVLNAAEHLGFDGVDLKNIRVEGLPLDEARVEAFQIPDLSPIGFSIAHLIKGLIKYIRYRLVSKTKSVH